MKPGSFGVINQSFNILEAILKACSVFFLFLWVNHGNISKRKNIFHIHTQLITAGNIKAKIKSDDMEGSKSTLLPENIHKCQYQQMRKKNNTYTVLLKKKNLASLIANVFYQCHKEDTIFWPVQCNHCLMSIIFS